MDNSFIILILFVYDFTCYFDSLSDPSGLTACYVVCFVGEFETVF